MKPTPFATVRTWLPQHNLLYHNKHQHDATICGVAIDSRRVTRGDLFFAIPGQRTDGHAHLAEVAARGGVAACVRTDYVGETHGLHLVHVPDVVEALQQMAHIFLCQHRVRTIAITGSMGKTTVKEYAKTFLSGCYRVVASPLSYNSQLTVPISIFGIDDTTEILLLEMGMSAPGHLAKLVAMAPPDLALLTTVTWQHADAFPDGLEGIAREKGAIFSHPTTRLGIYASHMPYADVVHQQGACHKETFSLSAPQADYVGHRTGSLLSICERGGEPYACDVSHLPQAYDHNVLAAVALARACGVPWSVLQHASTTLRPPPMRFELVQKRGVTFVNDAYNANPEAMMAALRSLPQPLQQGRTLAVLSEMNALGRYSDEGHCLVAQMALRHVDILLCIGERCRSMETLWRAAHKPCVRFETKQALICAVQEMVRVGDVVLLKGARAYALEEVLHAF